MKAFQHLWTGLYIYIVFLERKTLNADHSHWFSCTFTYARSFYRLDLCGVPEYLRCTSGYTTNRQSYFPHDEFDPRRMGNPTILISPVESRATSITRAESRSNNHGIIPRIYQNECLFIQFGSYQFLWEIGSIIVNSDTGIRIVISRYSSSSSNWAVHAFTHR